MESTRTWYHPRGYFDPLLAPYQWLDRQFAMDSGPGLSGHLAGKVCQYGDLYVGYVGMEVNSLGNSAGREV